MKIQPATIEAVEALDIVREHIRVWGMTNDKFAVLCELWQSMPQEDAIRKINALLNPPAMPDYDRVMNEAV